MEAILRIPNWRLKNLGRGRLSYQYGGGHHPSKDFLGFWYGSTL